MTADVMRATDALRKQQPKRAKGTDAQRRASVLRAGLRYITSISRVRRCAVTKCKQEIGVHVSGAEGSRVASPVGIMTCNSVWACPACSLRIRARRMSQLTRALRAGLAAYPRDSWGMITFTVRHRAGMALLDTRRGLMRAYRRWRQSGSVARILKREARASVRAVEITHSFANGWHPHLHVGMLGQELSETERLTMIALWGSCVVDAFAAMFTDRYAAKGYVLLSERRAALAAARQWAPTSEHGVRWSERRLRKGDGGTKLEAYLTDIGLELATVSTKTARAEDSRTAWQIAEAAAAGDAASARLWREYEQATKGARAIELDDRAAELADPKAVGRACDDVGGELTSAGDLEAAFAAAKSTGAESVYVPLHPEMMRHVREYERIDARATSLWLEAACAPGPLTVEAVEKKIDDAIRWMIRKTRPPPRRGATVAA